MPTDAVEELRELAPGVHRYEVDLGSRPFAGYVLEGRDGPLLVDSGVAGCAESAILPALEQLGYSADVPCDLVISHADADHFGGSLGLRRALPNVRLLAPAADRPLIEHVGRLTSYRYRAFEHEHGIGYDGETMRALAEMVEGDVPLDGVVVAGDSFPLADGSAAVVLATPGHTAGHVSLWLEGSRTAIVQDAILAEGVRSYEGDLIQPPPYLDRDDYLGTIAAIGALRPELLLTAHFPPLRGEGARDFVTRSHNWVKDFETVFWEVAPGIGDDFSAADLVPPLNARLGPYPVSGDLVYAITSLVATLRRDGRIAVVGGTRPVRWRLT